MIREPWSRVLSAFWEDNYKNDLRAHPERFVTSERNCNLIKDFENYLKDETHETYHRLQQTAYCGLGNPSYHFDHVLDISNSFDGLKDAPRDKTEVHTRMISGWEACTVEQTPSFYDGRIASPHHLGAGNSTYWTNQFCSDHIESLFKRRYIEDLDMYRTYFPQKKTGCVAYAAEDSGCV